MQKYLPVNIDLKGKNIVMIGGGKVALHKIKTLVKFTRSIAVVALDILPQIRALKVKCLKAAYAPNFLKGASLVYACTDSKKINAQIKKDANALGLMVNVADDKKLCDFISPAVLIRDGFTISVSSGGNNTKGAVALRDRLRELLR